MKKLFRILAYILAVLSILTLVLYALGYDYIIKAVRVTYLTGHTTAFIDDHSYFQNNTIPKAESVKEWPEHSEYNTINATTKLDSINKALETAAFLIIRNDSIWFEEYYNGYERYSKTNSFSMAKSVVTALMFKAIQDGYIENIDQPVADFFPQYDKRLRLGDLSSMASGLNWNENYYNPFASTAKAYFDNELREQTLNLKVIKEPGKKFEYLSGNTQLLALVIEKATGQTLSQYLAESFWKPLKMNDDGLWQVDGGNKKTEKAYCCIASNARNFAKLGRLFKNYGEWEGQQLLDSNYIALASSPRFKDAPHYGYGFWLSDHLEKDIFYMRGVLGQYVIIIPEDDIIIVRLGQQLIQKAPNDKHYKDFYMYIEETYKMLENAS